MKRLALLPLLFTTAISVSQTTNTPVQFAPPPPIPQVRPMQPGVPPQPIVTPVHTQPPSQLPDSILAWDSVSKAMTLKNGEAEARFSYYFTNVSTDAVTITSAPGSCGCTVANIPLPWRIEPGTNGVIPVVMNVAGKPDGMTIKTITVMTDKGNRILTVTTTVQLPKPESHGTNAALTMGADRSKNQDIAKADRQAVFKGDCARCHVEPLIGKTGKELYTAACGICHDAEHRATFVTDLHNLKTPPNAEYWKFMTMIGKPGTLMPAFAQSQGGPLTEAQINSLVEYLMTDFPKSKPAQAAAPTAPPK